MDRKKRQISEEFIFTPLTPFAQKQSIQLGIIKTPKNQRGLCIKISGDIKRHQLSKFLDEYWGIIEETSKIFQLPKNLVKAGRKQIVPADFVYHLYQSLKLTPKQIEDALIDDKDSVLKDYPELKKVFQDYVEINTVSISRAIERKKKSRREKKAQVMKILHDKQIH